MRVKSSSPHERHRVPPSDSSLNMMMRPVFLKNLSEADGSARPQASQREADLSQPRTRASRTPTMVVTTRTANTSACCMRRGLNRSR